MLRVAYKTGKDEEGHTVQCREEEQVRYQLLNFSLTQQFDNIYIDVKCEL